jgi:hypothetical protein
MANKSTTPWGAASVVDEVNVKQRAGDKQFASVVQLLEAGGERLVRFSYTTGAAGSKKSAVRRGPVTLRARDVERLRAELAKHPELAQFLGLATGNGGGA